MRGETDILPQSPAQRAAAVPEEASAASAAAPGGRRTALQVAAGAILAGLLAVAAFAPAVGNEFVYDDFPIIVQNTSVTEPGPWYRFWREPFWPREASVDKLYRPLTSASYRLNILLSGTDAPNPQAFRVVNILLHALTAAAVVVLGYRLSGCAAAGGVAGALFAVHPVLTEAVVTGYGRAELMAGLFSAWLLVLHAQPHRGRGAVPVSSSPPLPLSRSFPRRPLNFYVLSTLLFLAAIMSKEHALFIWPCILLIDLWRKGRTSLPPRPQTNPGDGSHSLPVGKLSRPSGISRPKDSRPLQPVEGLPSPLSRREWFNRVLGPTHLGFMLAATTFFLLRFALFGQFYRLENARVRVWDSPMAHATLSESLLTPFRLLWLTVEVFTWPGRLCPLWSIPALSPVGEVTWDVGLGMGVFVLALTGIVLLWRRWPAGAILAGLLLLLAMPTQALPLAHWIYAERWLYLPAVLAAVLAGMALRRLGPAGIAGGLALAILLLPSTWSYSAAFADSVTMYRTAVLRQPDSFHARRNLAMSLYKRGEYAAAIEAANEVIDRFEPVRDPYAVLLSAYLELGDGHRALEAIEAYERLQTDPGPSLTAARERAYALIAASSR